MDCSPQDQMHEFSEQISPSIFIWPTASLSISQDRILWLMHKPGSHTQITHSNPQIAHSNPEIAHSNLKLSVQIAHSNLSRFSTRTKLIPVLTSAKCHHMLVLSHYVDDLLVSSLPTVYPGPENTPKKCQRYIVAPVKSWTHPIIVRDSASCYNADVPLLPCWPCMRTSDRIYKHMIT